MGRCGRYAARSHLAQLESKQLDQIAVGFATAATTAS